jgi:ankyrin repeat protein
VGVTEVSPPLQALYEGDRDRGERLLAERDAVDVFEAAAFGRVDDLRRLLDEDAARASAFSSDGFTALHLAAFFVQPESAALLLERGADASARARNPMAVEPLHSAAAANQTGIAQLLLEAGADPDARQEGGFTAIHAAAHNGNAGLVELLLRHDADRTAATDDGRTAEQLARESGHTLLADSLA